MINNMNDLEKKRLKEVYEKKKVFAGIICMIFGYFLFSIMRYFINSFFNISEAYDELCYRIVFLISLILAAIL